MNNYAVLDRLFGEGLADDTTTYAMHMLYEALGPNAAIAMAVQHADGQRRQYHKELADNLDLRKPLRRLVLP